MSIQFLFTFISVLVILLQDKLNENENCCLGNLLIFWIKFYFYIFCFHFNFSERFSNFLCVFTISVVYKYVYTGFIHFYCSFSYFTTR